MRHCYYSAMVYDAASMPPLTPTYFMPLELMPRHAPLFSSPDASRAMIRRYRRCVILHSIRHAITLPLAPPLPPAISYRRFTICFAAFELIYAAFDTRIEGRVVEFPVAVTRRDVIITRWRVFEAPLMYRRPHRRRIRLSARQRVVPACPQSRQV